MTSRVIHRDTVITQFNKQYSVLSNDSLLKRLNQLEKVVSSENLRKFQWEEVHQLSKSLQSVLKRADLEISCVDKVNKIYKGIFTNISSEQATRVAKNLVQTSEIGTFGTFLSQLSWNKRINVLISLEHSLDSQILNTLLNHFFSSIEDRIKFLISEDRNFTQSLGHLATCLETLERLKEKFPRQFELIGQSATLKENTIQTVKSRIFNEYPHPEFSQRILYFLGFLRVSSESSDTFLFTHEKNKIYWFWKEPTPRPIIELLRYWVRDSKRSDETSEAVIRQLFDFMLSSSASYPLKTYLRSSFTPSVANLLCARKVNPEAIPNLLPFHHLKNRQVEEWNTQDMDWLRLTIENLKVCPLEALDPQTLSEIVIYLDCWLFKIKVIDEKVAKEINTLLTLMYRDMGLSLAYRVYSAHPVKDYFFDRLPFLKRVRLLSIVEKDEEREEFESQLALWLQQLDYQNKIFWCQSFSTSDSISELFEVLEVLEKSIHKFETMDHKTTEKIASLETWFIPPLKALETLRYSRQRILGEVIDHILLLENSIAQI